MNGSEVVGSGERSRVLNAVPLQNAVLCAECDVVSDSPHYFCLVCGSRSLFNVARIFGGILPKTRAAVIKRPEVDAAPHEVVVGFSKPHRSRRKSGGSRQSSVIAIEGEAAQSNRIMLVGAGSD